MACEMCGSETSLILVEIESVELNVCNKCASFGKKIRRPKKIVQKKQDVRKVSGPEIIQAVRDDYSKVIRDKREKLGLKQQEFARFLSEKESLIHKIEAGNYTPSLQLARKMERQLSIKLIEQKKIEPQKLERKKATLTIGDMIKLN